MAPAHTFPPPPLDPQMPPIRSPTHWPRSPLPLEHHYVLDPSQRPSTPSLALPPARRPLPNHCSPSHPRAVRTHTLAPCPPCPCCGRPLPLQGQITESHSRPFTSPRLSCCWRTLPSTPFTPEAASRSTLQLQQHALPGVLPTSLLRQWSCSGPIPPRHHTLRALIPPPSSQPPPDTLPAIPSPDPLRLLSVNCGGVAAKIPELLALILSSDADIVCLQEAAGARAGFTAGFPVSDQRTVPCGTG